MSGYCAQKLPSRRGTKYFAVLTTATRSRPLASPFHAASCCSQSIQSSSMRRAVAASASPASVSCTRRPTSV